MAAHFEKTPAAPRLPRLAAEPKPAPVRPAAPTPHRGVVPPVPEGTLRPLWSVMIPVYNCARDLERSLAAVVMQTEGRQDMQIEVVDDCSTADDPEAVVREVGRGRARFYRQPRNVGHSRNFNTCLARARGELVHLLHADDWVGEGFYDGMSQLFAAHPKMGAAFCRHAIVETDGTTQWISPLERDTPGILKGWLEKIAGEQRIQAPAVVVRRDVYEALGGFDTRIATCGEDWEMWVRIAAAYPIGFLPDLLAFYQDNPASLTKRSIRSGQNIRDLRLATRIVRDHLPADLARRTANRALGNWAELALRWARLAARQGNTRSTFVQLREALYCSRSPETLRAAVRIGRVGLENALRRPKAAAQTEAPAAVQTQRPTSGLTRFVIVGTAQTGSTMLISLINGHSQALTFGEIFRSPAEIGWDDAEYARTADKNALALYRHDPLRFLQRTIYREWKSGQQAMGFKLFYYHAREAPFSVVWDYLQTETDIRVLHIKRRNILAQYLSLQRAHLTNQWSGRDSGGAAETLFLSANDCRRHFLWVRAKEAETDAFFARHPLLEIEYEALVADTAGQMGKVQDFLGSTVRM
jgi:GT2 family glycosyltransferase/LPS sulfotransferase NodH